MHVLPSAHPYYNAMSTQPSTLRGTVNEYQPHGWVIQMAMSDCLVYSSLQEDSVVSLQHDLCAGNHPALAYVHSSDLSELLQWFCHRWFLYKHHFGIIIIVIIIIMKVILRETRWAVGRCWGSHAIMSRISVKPSAPALGISCFSGVATACGNL